MIKSGEFKPGDRLPTEKQLTEELGVSRTCIREAIKSLESRQLIRVRPKIGAIVLEPSPSTLINSDQLSATAHQQRPDALIEFRKILELGLVALAAEKSTEDDWEILREILAEHERAVKIDRGTPEGDRRFYEETSRANVRFHKAIAEATRNPIAILVLEGISEPLAKRSRRTYEMPGEAEAGLREHWAIYRAIRERNPDRARSQMTLHLQNAELAVQKMQGSEEDVSLPPIQLGG